MISLFLHFFPTMLSMLLKEKPDLKHKELHWTSNAKCMKFMEKVPKIANWWTVLFQSQNFGRSFWKFYIIFTDDISKELELCMNWLINGERFTSCADINFGLLNMKGMFNGFYSKLMRAHWRWLTKLIFVAADEDVFTFDISLILKFLIKYVIRILTSRW